MKKFTYSVLVVLYNPERRILKQLDIYANEFDKVYLFDNSDEKVEWITEFAKSRNIEYYSSNNVGITGALNVIIPIAINEKFDFIATMDQDTIFPSEVIQKMISNIELNYKEDIAIYTTNFNKMYVGEGGKIEYSKPEYDINKVTYTNFHISSGNFLRCDLISNLFPLDNYFIGFVDFDLDFSVKTLGYKILVIGECIISQQIGNPIKASVFTKQGLTNFSSSRYYYLYRNNYYFNNKFKNYKEAKKFAKMKRIKYFIKLLTTERNKIEKIKMSYKGYCDYKKGILGIKK